MLNNQDDRIISQENLMTQKLGERAMSEMFEMLLEMRSLITRVEKLEQREIERSENRKHEASQGLSKVAIWIAILVGSVQIVLMSLQMFMK